LRMLRENAGPNTNSNIAHRGTGGLFLTAQDAGTVGILSGKFSGQLQRRKTCGTLAS
jgi:hypothetical protein